jgi:predicted nucleotidyltransferase
MSNIIDKNREKIKEICRQQHILTLFVFGSVLTDHFNADSDIDMLVSFDKQKIGDYFSHFFDFKYALEDVLKRKVDLLEEQPFKNSYLQKSIDSTKTLIYERQR